MAKKPWLAWIDRNNREQCEWVLIRLQKTQGVGVFLHDPGKDDPYDSIMSKVHFWPRRDTEGELVLYLESVCKKLRDAWSARLKRKSNDTKRTYSFVMRRTVQAKIRRLCNAWQLDRNDTIESLIGLCDDYEKWAKLHATRDVDQQIRQLKSDNNALKDQVAKLKQQRGYGVLNKTNAAPDPLLVEMQNMQASLLALGTKVDLIAGSLVGAEVGNAIEQVDNSDVTDEDYGVGQSKEAKASAKSWTEQCVEVSEEDASAGKAATESTFTDKSDSVAQPEEVLPGIESREGTGIARPETQGTQTVFTPILGAVEVIPRISFMSSSELSNELNKLQTALRANRNPDLSTVDQLCWRLARMECYVLSTEQDVLNRANEHKKKLLGIERDWGV